MQCTDRFYEAIPDFRDPFARDRDRVIHTSSFRRLEYKTQVFINHEGDYFRTRLTHSLEVSQIARAIATALGCHETLAETIALAHDLGHTPFGHVGGDTLDECLRRDGNLNGFEHNFQSFRVVTKLEKRYAPFDGLNLTFATLEGILKHSYPYRKPFLTDWYDEVFGLDFHPSLEAMIVDHADEIAYISHDIDDGIQYGLIAFGDILENDLVVEIDAKVRAEGLKQGTKLHRYRFVGMLISHLVTELIEASRHRLPKTGGILCRTLPASEPSPIRFEPELATRIKRLKKLLFEKLYRHERIVSKMHAGKECIRKLYAALREDSNLLPKEYKERLEKEKKERVVADFIAGMSDRYALMRYREIYGLG
ncbi:deoxyguanosinetriphosphate triphosphohydrolase [Hydrogenimonas sp.]